jgi:hypothetical protein
MKRRAIVLQAVEHAQNAPDRTFLRFTGMMEREQLDLDELEMGLSMLLLDISHLRLRSPSRFMDKLMWRDEVNDLLEWPGRLRELAMQESSQLGAPAPTLRSG